MYLCSFCHVRITRRKHPQFVNVQQDPSEQHFCSLVCKGLWIDYVRENKKIPKSYIEIIGYNIVERKSTDERFKTYEEMVLKILQEIEPATIKELTKALGMKNPPHSLVRSLLKQDLIVRRCLTGPDTYSVKGLLTV